MPRTTIAAVAAPGAFPTAGVVITGTAADTVNQNRTTFSGRELLIAFNSGATPRTVTITSIADRFGRLGSITAESIAAGAYRMYGPFTNAEGWRQTDAFLYYEANHAEVLFFVIQLPATN
jgi:hypothetical protein